MLGSALYFPHMDIDDPVWLRSAILFWDEIQTIAPTAIEEPYQNEDARICHAEGYLRPLRCDLHPTLIDDLGRRILRSSDLNNGGYQPYNAIRNSVFRAVRYGNSIGEEVEDALQQTGVFSNKMSPALREFALRFGLATIHSGKMPYHIRDMFQDLEIGSLHRQKLPRIFERFYRQSERFDAADNEWLLVDSRFANAYMSALAADLSQKLDLSPLTSNETAQGMAFRFMFDDVVDSSPTTGAMLGVVMRALRVDASVPVLKLLRFRESRRDQYLDFAGKLGELTEQLRTDDDAGGEALFEKAQAAYKTGIEPSLRALKRELDQQSISTVWEGAYRAITISVPSAGALAYFTGLSGPALLGAGAALAAADIGVRGYLAQRRARATNPFSYLHDITENFGLPAFTEA